MSQVYKIVKWEFINRVKTKLFLITTFALPFFMGGIMYLPSVLMDLEPEDKSRIGLIYKSDIVSLINRFKNQCDKIFVTQEGDPQFIFKDLDSEQEALKDILDKRIDGYLVIPNSILLVGIKLKSVKPLLAWRLIAE